MIYGCDVAMRRVALACPTTGTVTLWTSPVARMVPVELLCAEVARWAATAVDTGDVVAVELPVVAGMRNLQSTIKVALVTGAVMAGLGSAGAVVHPVAISTWKKEICGHGNLDKAGVASWLHEHHPDLAAICGQVGTFTQDAVDATCIALWAQAVSDAA